MVRDVDKSEIVGSHLIESPVLGPIPPSQLSGGVKTLILILNDDTNIYNASNCGDNCAKWLLKIGELKDITVRLGYLMEFGDKPYKLRIVNNGKIYTENDKEALLFDAVKFINEESEK